MKCPLCDQTMREEKNTSFREDGKQYSKTLYNCKKDDVWIVVEIPKK